MWLLVEITLIFLAVGLVGLISLAIAQKKGWDNKLTYFWRSKKYFPIRAIVINYLAVLFWHLFKNQFNFLSLTVWKDTAIYGTALWWYGMMILTFAKQTTDESIDAGESN